MELVNSDNVCSETYTIAMGSFCSSSSNSLSSLRTDFNEDFWRFPFGTQSNSSLRHREDRKLNFSLSERRMRQLTKSFSCCKRRMEMEMIERPTEEEKMGETFSASIKGISFAYLT